MSARGADLSKAKSGTVIPAAEAAAQKERLAACETRIETGLKSFAGVGAALAEIRDSKLYMLSHKTFEDYCEQRWELSRKRAYDQAAAAAVVSQICDKNMPPPAIESHAAALAAAPEHLRGQVWAKVREQTGGKPTAKAVAAAAEAAKRDYDAAEPVTAAEKAAYGRAYEAARAAGGGAPAYIAAGREAVMAYRREHPAPAAGPGQGKPSVPADHAPNGSKTAEDSSRGKADRPVSQVQQSVTDGTTPASATAEPVAATAETVQTATAAETRPHVHVFACSCGTTDTAFSEQVGTLMDELSAKDKKIADLQAKLSAALEAAGRPYPGNGTGMAGNLADSAPGNGQAAPDAYGAEPAPDGLGEEPQADPGLDEFAELFGDIEDFGDAPAPDEGSQVPAGKAGGGKRRRG